MINFKGKSILVLGLKTSGIHVIHLLNAHDIPLVVSDQSISINDISIDLQLNKMIAYDTIVSHIKQFDILIKSPGIKDEIDIIQAAYLNHVQVISEIEAAYQFMPLDKKIIGVTGTNGKTTTTTLITKVLNKAGIKACSCGNIGYTLSEAILVDLYDVFVCECSSFQLNNIKDFKVDIALFLNITPNHLDYHQTFEQYLQAKLNLMSHVKKEGLLIYNLDDATITSHLSDNKMRKQTFSLKNDEADCFEMDGAIVYHNRLLIRRSEISLLGNENIANIMAVILTCGEVGISETVMYKAISEFMPLKYRIEYIDTYEGVAFYNDSKSTNVSASLCAVSALEAPILLILGGKIKDDNYKLLLSNEKIKLILAYGESRYHLKHIADGINKVCFMCDNLLEVMRLLKKVMSKGDCVLFSPGAQSFDLYQNYVERGEDFNKLFATVIKF